MIVVTGIVLLLCMVTTILILSLSDALMAYFFLAFIVVLNSIRLLFNMNLYNDVSVYCLLIKVTVSDSLIRE